MSRNIFITGIDTGVGKTIVSAVVSESLKAAYWKPVQSGLDEATDTETISQLTSNVEVLPEAWRLKTPASPHFSAQVDGVFINKESLSLPKTSNDFLVIEGAGGLMVPLNNEGLILADMIKEWKAEVIVVVKNYLGSINHSLLTLEYLKNHQIPVLGIIVSGDENQYSESFILKYANLELIGRIPFESDFNPSLVSNYANQIYPNLNEVLSRTR
jgi:dethiobiotin synthetase